VDRTPEGFDPYPFILLNLVLSCLAALQGAILLIAARRSDQIASELARHDYEADTRTRDVVEGLASEIAALRAEQQALHAARVQARSHSRRVDRPVSVQARCPCLPRGSGSSGPGSARARAEGW
jgi:uncharacterized membrane protein